MALDQRRRARARAANALRPTPPFFDPAPVRSFRTNNFELLYFNDPDWSEKIRGIETLTRFHRLTEFLDLVRDYEHEYARRDADE